jgi:hypothetical protein
MTLNDRCIYCAQPFFAAILLVCSTTLNRREYILLVRHAGHVKRPPSPATSVLFRCASCSAWKFSTAPILVNLAAAAANFMPSNFMQIIILCFHGVSFSLVAAQSWRFHTPLTAPRLRILSPRSIKSVATAAVCKRPRFCCRLRKWLEYSLTAPG